MKMAVTKQRSADADWRWLAVKNKANAFDGVFYFAVRTTGIFCRPSCASRPPKRENVSFFPTRIDAERAGFRPCKRCRPDREYFPGIAADLVAKAFDAIRRAAGDGTTVEEVCRELGVTPGHLRRTFQTLLGVSPKEVIDMTRIENFKENVRETDVTTSLYDSGFGSSRALYEKAGARLGMTPATYKKGGKGETIGYTIVESPLGKLLVAATERGICSVMFGETEEELRNELAGEFFAAKIENTGEKLRSAVTAILRSLDGETTILTLPLDLRATAFQMRVWSELRKIPYGETRSYAEVAENIGKPKAVRAVARACATNPVALVTPCHRVIASDGKLAGYRWGIERKKQILDSERKSVKAIETEPSAD